MEHQSCKNIGDVLYDLESCPNDALVEFSQGGYPCNPRGCGEREDIIAV